MSFLTFQGKTLELIRLDVRGLQMEEPGSFCQESLSGAALTFFTLDVGAALGFFFFFFLKRRLERITVRLCLKGRGLNCYSLWFFITGSIVEHPTADRPPLRPAHSTQQRNFVPVKIHR